MQYSHTLRQKKTDRFSWSYLLKIALLVFVLSYIYVSLARDSGRFQSQWLLLKQSELAIGSLVIVTLLMPINWLLEARKWQIITSKIQKISIWQALSGVLAGVSLGFSTPHAVGDYIARIGQLQSNHRWGLTGGLLLGRLAQLFFTALFGIGGLFLYAHYQVLPAKSWPWKETGFALLCVLLILLFAWKGRQAVYRFFYQRKFKIQRLLVSLMSLETKEVFRIFLLSMLRNLVFSGQYLILLILIFPQEPFWLLLGGVWWVFLFKSFLPSFSSLSDLGIREFSALLYFQSMGFESAPIVAVSLAVWIINILIPALMGLPFLWRIRFLTKSK